MAGKTIDLFSPDVTPVPDGFPSADAASILCAVSDNQISWYFSVI